MRKLTFKRITGIILAILFVVAFSSILIHAYGASTFFAAIGFTILVVLLMMLIAYLII